MPSARRSFELPPARAASPLRQARAAASYSGEAAGAGRQGRAGLGRPLLPGSRRRFAAVLTVSSCETSPQVAGPLPAPRDRQLSAGSWTQTSAELEESGI